MQSLHDSTIARVVAESQNWSCSRRQHQRRHAGVASGHDRQRGSDGNDRCDPVVLGVQGHGRPERVARESERGAGPSRERVKSGDHVEPLGDAVAAAAEIEPHRRESAGGQGGEQGIDHVVEPIAAVCRVWVTHHDAAACDAVRCRDVGFQQLPVGCFELYGLHGCDGTLAVVASADQKIPIKMLNDRLLVKPSKEDGERSSSGGILIPATAQMAKRLVWAEVVALGQNVRSAEVGDQVLYSPDDRYEVEVGGEDLIMLRERDLHAVAAQRIESSTGLYL